MTPSQNLARLGLKLPAPTQVPAGARLPFAFVHVAGARVIVSGHGPTDAHGTIAGPFGKVGRDVTLEQAQAAARATTLAMFADIAASIGSIDWLGQCVKVLGMVNAAPGFTQMPQVVNGCSDLILEVLGPQFGRHARSAVGVAELPWNIPVEIEAEFLLAPTHPDLAQSPSYGA